MAPGKRQFTKKRNRNRIRKEPQAVDIILRKTTKMPAVGNDTNKTKINANVTSVDLRKGRYNKGAKEKRVSRF